MNMKVNFEKGHPYAFESENVDNIIVIFITNLCNTIL